jgi:hypothetical protein
LWAEKLSEKPDTVEKTQNLLTTRHEENSFHPHDPFRTLRWNSSRSIRARNG